MSLLSGQASAMLVDQDLVESPPTGPERTHLTLIASGLSSTVEGINQVMPTDIDAFPDASGRLAVMTLGGVIRVIDADGLVDEPYLIVANDDSDVRPGLYGMISILFHPEFALKGSAGFGKFYTIETELEGSGVPDFDGSLAQTAFGGVHHDVVYEYTASDPSASVFDGTRREVLRVEQPGQDHNVFDLEFGIGEHEGMLFISSGDGANASPGEALIRDNPQFRGNVFGTVLRIDPMGNNSSNGQYGVPADNPFVGVDGVVPEIYSYGHRSPYRITVDRETGDLWLGEVGQRQIEEVNKVVAGGNYGWPFKEGSFLFDELDHDNNMIDPDADSNGTGDFADANNLIDPHFELDHQSARSVTGGYVYRGAAMPGLIGSYVFSDAAGNGLYYADPDGGPISGATGGVQLVDLDPAGLAMPFGTISIGEDVGGEIYLLSFDGRVIRLDPWKCNASDINGDGGLNFFDVSRFLELYGQRHPIADIDQNGSFNFFDVSLFLQNYAEGC